MKNPADYHAGFTKKMVNPKTGKQCSGGASRNLKVALAGGAVAMQEAAFTQGAMLLLPLIDGYQNELRKYDRALKKAMQLINHRSAYEK
jgi:hypothetical protein